MYIRMLPLLIVLCITAGCVFYPRHVHHYDADCQIRYKQLVLETNSMHGIQFHCADEGCIAALLFISAEALVAGSLVIVGNTVYWLEKEGRCALKKDQEESSRK